MASQKEKSIGWLSELSETDTKVHRGYKLPTAGAVVVRCYVVLVPGMFVPYLGSDDDKIGKVMAPGHGMAGIPGCITGALSLNIV